MASVTNPVQSPVCAYRFSSMYLSPIRILPSLVQLKPRSLASRASSLSFSPSSEKLKPLRPLGLSCEPLRFSSWTQELRRRGRDESPVVAAAAADAEGREIEIDGLDLLFLSSFCLKEKKKVKSFYLILIFIFLCFGCSVSGREKRK